MHIFKVLGLALAMVISTGFSGSLKATGEVSQVFDVYISGLRAGTISLRSRVDGPRYIAEGAVATGGMVALFVDFNFTGTSQGQLSTTGTLTPSRYIAHDTNSKRVRETEMLYANGVPKTVSVNPPRSPAPHDLDPTGQRGTMDPIAATFMLLRDIPAEKACDQTLHIYDGAKRSRITVGKRQEAGDAWVCQGLFKRISGYSARELEKQSEFEFSIRFVANGDGTLRVEKFLTMSDFGQVAALRR